MILGEFPEEHVTPGKESVAFPVVDVCSSISVSHLY